jgi:hypothetical protein
MVFEDVTKKEVEKYFKARYSFEDDTKTLRGGLNDTKKSLSKVMQVKPKTLNDAFKSWKKKIEGSDEEDDSAEVLEIVEAINKPKTV